MSLRLKFNLILVAMGIFGLLVAGLIAYDLQIKHAREEILETAAILMESALAVRDYTVDEVSPLISDSSAGKFVVQTVPAYAAAKYVHNLQEKRPNYFYKEAALNPTNPLNRATDWEVDIIDHFRSHDIQEMVGERDTPIGKTLYLSRPIRINNPSCLVCHSTPAAAPAALLDRYGNSNGFGWQLNEVIGAQIVSVPQSVALERAHHEFYLFVGALLGVFLVVGLALNLLLHRFVIAPVIRMAEHADKVSTGTLDLPELKVTGKDEIASLGRSFNRMQRSLGSAVNMLNDTMD